MREIIEVTASVVLATVVLYILMLRHEAVLVATGRADSFDKRPIVWRPNGRLNLVDTLISSSGYLILLALIACLIWYMLEAVINLVV